MKISNKAKISRGVCSLHSTCGRGQGQVTHFFKFWTQNHVFGIREAVGT